MGHSSSSYCCQHDDPAAFVLAVIGSESTMGRFSNGPDRPGLQAVTESQAATRERCHVFVIVAEDVKQAAYTLAHAHTHNTGSRT